MIQGYISDPVVDPDEIAPDRFEFVCSGCNLVAHKGGIGFTNEGRVHMPVCRDCRPTLRGE